MDLLSRIGSILLVRAESFSYQCCVLSDSVRQVLPWFISLSSSCFIVKECLVRSYSLGWQWSFTLLSESSMRKSCYGIQPTSLGKFVVLLLVQIFSSVMVWVYVGDKGRTRLLLTYVFGVTGLALLFSEFVIPFDVVWIQLVLSACVIGYLVYNAMNTRFANYFYIALFALGSIAFFYSADYVLNDVMQPHQRVRINVLLGLDEDLAGAGYNVHQSEIAIGSGGLQGKGFLNGTQTKLKFVPEQDTDFIFCTVGEEEGFLGSASVLVLFLFLILRLMYLADRQPFKFGRVYGYCVAGIFLFHLFINVGMVLGLTPVIGIPLPFFSYGGSSLWGFTLLLFIFLRIDAGRNLIRQ